MMKRRNLLFVPRKVRPDTFIPWQHEFQCWKMKQITIERGILLFIAMQITSNQCQTRTSISECLDCHILRTRTISSRRSTTKQCLRPIEWEIQENDKGPRHYRVVWIVWDRNTTQGVLIPLEFRHHFWHLWASLERQWSQPKCHSMSVGRSLDSKVFLWEGTTTWPSI